MEFRPIAFAKTDFKDKFGIPRQSGRVKQLVGEIHFLPEYSNPEAFRGLENFSHMWVIFDFSGSHRSKFSSTVRPPRLGGNKRVGVFSSRSPFRPNPIGLSCVKIEKIEKNAQNNIVITVSGIDLLDGTPILDVKPYIPYCDCVHDATGSFAQENKDHRLEVDFPEEFLKLIPSEKRTALINCIRDDPRPAYQNDPNRIYKMKFDVFDVEMKIFDGKASIVGIKPL
ncbi:MAG: tRNA (N6-threonylcarbamoyladenosine(37)-N6)-methyltransferase TrmO [Clostridia bacterium]|nr:tRNA (N6-threonylcarbamoyladenosine(37)-N6)-methyltransferase TrmO [Clostridia bacterium]